MKKSAFFILLLFPFFTHAQQNSVLSAGDWYKIAVEETGVHIITYTDLITYGINPDQIDPENLTMFGNPAGMLPESLEDSYYTDLQQLAIQVIGEEDGIFNAEDYILFYGQAPDIWEYDQDLGHYHHQLNIYADVTMYFLTIGEEPGKRISLNYGTDIPQTINIDTLDLLLYHEQELVNVAKTGKQWLGEVFEDQTPQSFDFDISDYLLYQDGHYFSTLVSARSTDVSNFTIELNGEYLTDISVSSVSPTSTYQKFRSKQTNFIFQLNETGLTIDYSFSQPNDSAIGWLDYIGLNLKIKPVFTGKQMMLRSAQNAEINGVSFYSLDYGSPEQIHIWHVTDPVNIENIALNIEPDHVWFQLESDGLLEFLAFDGSSYFEPEFVEHIANQNLHALESSDLIIATHPDFLIQAGELAELHETEDDFSVGVVTTEQVYNEFSSGIQDITAIRNFMRYLRDNSRIEQKPKYLLLFGDASYDYKDRLENNTNYVPTYETWESSNLVWSFAADDYFGLKEPWNNGFPEIGVGRIPAKSTAEASNAIEKIINYYANESIGSWKNEMMFIGDDGDMNLHLRQADYLSRVIDTNDMNFNISKPYLDFFDLVQTDEGPRYPEVNMIINKKMNDGVFYVNYVGHGGEKQLAHERILSEDDLPGWSNKFHMPLWVIASGEVAHFDNPEFTSLGEEMFLKNDAGAIAVVSPSRGVFASSSLIYNTAIVEQLVDESVQENLRLGDLVKNQPLGGENDSKWVLLGDPALKLSFPELNVNTSIINGIEITEYTDTIPPGSFLIIDGKITSKDNVLQSNFNGMVYLKVFAPPYIKTTNGNQGTTVTEVMVQDSILVTGTASIENGEFEMQVHLPANYYEGFGNLKLSWYAENGETDANGYYNQLIYGGEPDAIDETDEILAQIKVYPTVFSNTIKVEVPLDIDQMNNLQVFNTMGQVVYSNHDELTQGITTLKIPDLSKGMYIVNVEIGAGSRNFKVFRY